MNKGIIFANVADSTYCLKFFYSSLLKLHCKIQLFYLDLGDDEHNTSLK